MKKYNFSRLFAAVAFVAVLVLSGCNQPKDETGVSIYGNWVSAWGEKYEITTTAYNNYYTYDNDFTLYYSTAPIAIKEITSTSGFVYGKFNDETHIGYGAQVGQWYALYYTDLTDTSVNFYQPYKAGGKAGCDTLEEAKTEYTIDNGYFNLETPSTCTKTE